MAIELPALPWARDALAPHISAETIDYHYGKHHQTYVTNTNNQIKGTEFENMDLVAIIKKAQGGLFNNAAQVWNHTFFWDSLKPGGGGAPPAGDVADLINGLGGWDKFRADFIAAGMGRFGSGWAWLVLDGGKGKIMDTPNAETPLTTSAVPLLTCDVWEHAYYIDHRNLRPKFLETYMNSLANWDFAEANFA